MQPYNCWCIPVAIVNYSPGWEWLWSFPCGGSCIVINIVSSAMWVFSLLPAKDTKFNSIQYIIDCIDSHLDSLESNVMMCAFYPGGKGSEVLTSGPS